MINTGGGMYNERGTVHNSYGTQVNASDGAYVGSVGGSALSGALADARQRIAALDERELDVELLTTSLNHIEAEIANGDAADETRIARALRTLGGLVPDIAAVVIASLTSPTAGVTTAVSAAARRVSEWIAQRPAVER
jgi:hypothetical protein